MDGLDALQEIGMLRVRQALLGQVLAVEPEEELLFPALKRVQDGINLIDLRGVVLPVERQETCSVKVPISHGALASGSCHAARRLGCHAQDSGLHVCHGLAWYTLAR